MRVNLDAPRRAKATDGLCALRLRLFLAPHLPGPVVECLTILCLPPAPTGKNRLPDVPPFSVSPWQFKRHQPEGTGFGNCVYASFTKASAGPQGPGLLIPAEIFRRSCSVCRMYPVVYGFKREIPRVPKKHSGPAEADNCGRRRWHGVPHVRRRDHLCESSWSPDLNCDRVALWNENLDSRIPDRQGCWRSRCLCRSWESSALRN